MVQCLVTLTDLETRRAGLPATAELVVIATVRSDKTEASATDKITYGLVLTC